MERDPLRDISQFEARRSKAITFVCDGLDLWPRRNLMRRVFNYVAGIEHGMFFSPTLRRWMASKYGVEVGAYSYGPCLTPGGLPPGVRIGRYVSMAPNVRVSMQNKAMGFIAMHPLFYEAAEESGNRIHHTSQLVIEHDAWLGDYSFILPGCKRIGIGAVVGGGAVVTKDVPDFAIVGGNPATILRYRFDEKTREEVLLSKWWESAYERVDKKSLRSQGKIA